MVQPIMNLNITVTCRPIMRSSVRVERAVASEPDIRASPTCPPFRSYFGYILHCLLLYSIP